MKVIVAGGRDFKKYYLISKVLKELLMEYPDMELVSGGCIGADTYGELFAKKNSVITKVFPANWDKYGLKAGPIRNKQMAEYADALVAFWDGKSQGTSNMINLARSNNLLVRVIRY